MANYKYLDLAGLTLYDGKIKAWVNDKITEVNTSIQDLGTIKSNAEKGLTAYNAWVSFLAGTPSNTITPTLSELAKSDDVYTKDLVYTKTEVDGIKSNLEAYADQAETDAIAASKSYVDGLKIADTYATKTELSTAVEDLNTEVDKKADKATTLAGYGITDAYTKTEVDGIKNNLEAYADQAETDAIAASKSYVDGLKIADTYATKTELSDLNTVVGGKADKATTLDGYGITDAYTKGEVNTVVETAKKEILGITDDETINAAYDTLKEVADWIANDTSGAAAMQSDINNLKNGKADKATTLDGYGITDAYTKTEVDGIKNNLEAYADQAETDAIAASKSYVDGLKIADTYATKTELSDLNTVVGGKADKATTLDGYGITDAYTKTEVNGIKSNLEAYADQAEIDAVNTVVGSNSDTSSSNTIYGAKKYTDALGVTLRDEFSHVAISESEINDLFPQVPQA